VNGIKFRINLFTSLFLLSPWCDSSSHRLDLVFFFFFGILNGCGLGAMVEYENVDISFSITLFFFTLSACIVVWLFGALG
jgi:hypothetical protein